MKLIFSIYLIVAWTFVSFCQSVIDNSKTKSVTQNGIEITTFESKPFTGFVVESYSNGKPKSWKTLKNGITNGLWQEWYENGKLKFNAYWLDGKGHGLWEYYHENGQLRQEEFYNLDIPIGIFKVYFENGQLKSNTSWNNGKKHGIWTFYNENGTVLKTEVYDDNKLLSTTEK